MLFRRQDAPENSIANIRVRDTARFLKTCFICILLFFESLFGRKGRQGGGFGGFQGFSSGGSGFGRQARTSTGEMNANVSIDLYTAMLGGEVMITLSNGQKVKMKIKPETQPGTKVRLRGKGYDRGDGTFGDLIITYQVKLPTNLTERQKELLRQMKGA